MRTSVAAIGVVLAALSGCRGPDDGRDRMEIRPFVVKAGKDGYALPRTPRHAPAAYFDRAQSKMFVDAAFRPAVIELTHAEVGPTRVWSFQVGGELLQGQEAEIQEWDPSVDPKLGDVQVVTQECETVTTFYACVPLLGTKPQSWIDGPPIENGECIGDRERLCWQQWSVIGRCTEYSDAECTKRLGEGNVMGWSCLQL